MNIFQKVYGFYYNGFKEMTLGRTLWLLIAIKLFIIFGVLKIFFFPDLLSGKSQTEKAIHIREHLIQKVD
ncbi:MAG: DUF4492 domain-containing protein [Rikenellaceae bacterium]